MANLMLPFSGSAEATDPEVVFGIQSVGGGTAIQATGGADQGGYGGVALEALAVSGGTAVRARNEEVDQDGNPGWAVEAIAQQGGIAVVARTTGTDQARTDAGTLGNAGIGVDAACDSGGIGMRGRSTGTDPDGNAGPAILGTSEFGVGVRAASDNVNSFAIAADGDAFQARENGGWAKALVYLDHGKLTRFYTSQLDRSAPEVYRLDVGLYSIDFHFQVNDRYVVVTPLAGTYEKAGVSNEPNPFAPSWYPPPAGSNFQQKFLVANMVFDGFRSPPDFTTPPPEQRQPASTMVTVMTFQPVFITGGGGPPTFQGFKLQDTSICVAVF